MTWVGIEVASDAPQCSRITRDKKNAMLVMYDTRTNSGPLGLLTDGADGLKLPH
jgi:hypothetical protein